MMGFLRTGNNAQKANSTVALRELASSSDESCEAIVRDGAISTSERTGENRN
ncbi:hypothetical protein JG687_00010498 [Phytophthora cactorum]|uniref:Uncharacterized protein n=2 Tax=Phytophthora TaxID=4783 RepID=A0A8J5IQT8_9STRA|nr:hypothetical protein JG687_00010498 [Phytophthora cactorum]KAG6958754.1 hypothetical protein JG688_00010367 [Phytophthora aleatoria]